MKSNLRQPGTTTNISDDYDDHLDRGSLGGDDLTDSYGTVVHAQLDSARVTIVDNSPDGSGGRYSRVTGPDGDSVESLHQASITAIRGALVDAEDPIGRSGASAYGSNYGTGGPHIHNHGVRANGARFNLEPYYWWLNGGSHAVAAAVSSSTPIAPASPIGRIRRMFIFWQTENNVPTAAYLTNGIQSVRIENDIDGEILAKVIGSTGYKTAPAFSGAEKVRIDYYLDLLKLDRPGQPDHGTVQPNA